MTHHPSTPIHDHDRLHLEFALSPDEFVRAHLFLSRPVLWRRTRLYSVLAVTFAVIAWTRTMPDWLLIWMLPLVYAVSALSIIPMTRYQLRLAYRTRRGLQAVNRVTLSAEGYRTDSGGTELLVRWHAFSHYLERPTAFLLFTGPRNALVLPRSAVTPDQQTQVCHLLHDRIGRTTPPTAAPGFPLAPPPTPAPPPPQE